MTGISLAKQAEAVTWFHSMDLGKFSVTGHKSADLLKAEADRVFTMPLAGKHVLDVGASDGWFSFEAKRRGAERVLATDKWAWSHLTKDKGFQIAKRALGLDVESKLIAVDEITPAEVGRHDVVLLLGVIYHLTNPFAAIERVSKVCKETLVLETIISLDDGEPQMKFYPYNELHNDYSNWWAPNQSCLEGMLKVCGFKSVTCDIRPHPNKKTGRVIAHAYKWRPEDTEERIVLIDGLLRHTRMIDEGHTLSV